MCRKREILFVVYLWHKLGALRGSHYNVLLVALADSQRIKGFFTTKPTPVLSEAEWEEHEAELNEKETLMRGY